MNILKKGKNLLLILCVILNISKTFSQSKNSNAHHLDSVLTNKFPYFSGIVLYAKNNKIDYVKTQGFANYEKQIPIDKTTKFIIGSISQQITTVLVLQAVDRKKIDLESPVGKYLPKLTASWKNSVKVKHLLAHSHGILSMEDDLMFVPGTSVSYSELGYHILAEILESTTHKSFAILSQNLFKKCKMTNTFHPDNLKNQPRAIGYNTFDSTFRMEDTSHINKYIAARGFISTAEDLFKWNSILHSGKLLKKNTYKMMMAPQQIVLREYKSFDISEFGLETTLDSNAHRIRFGYIGYEPGFACLNFYYPKTKSQFIVLQNYTLDYRSLLYTFEVHLVGLSQLEEEK